MVVSQIEWEMNGMVVAINGGLVESAKEVVNI